MISKVKINNLKKYFYIGMSLIVFANCGGGGGGGNEEEILFNAWLPQEESISADLVSVWNLESVVTESDCPDLVPLGLTVSESLEVTETECLLNVEDTESEDTESEGIGPYNSINANAECRAAGDRVAVYFHVDSSYKDCHYEETDENQLALDSESQLSGTFTVDFRLYGDCGGNEMSCSFKGEVTSD